MAKREKTATVQLKVRMREELRRKLEKTAQGRDVSLNSEMVDRLEQSFSAAGVEALLELTGIPAEETKLLALVLGMLRANRGWKKDAEKQDHMRTAFDMFIRFCATGEITNADINDGMGTTVGKMMAYTLTGQAERDFLQKKD